MIIFMTLTSILLVLVATSVGRRVAGLSRVLLLLLLIILLLLGSIVVVIGLLIKLWLRMLLLIILVAICSPGLIRVSR